MFRHREKRGFILIYVLFICSICFVIVLGIYKMEVLKKSNNLKMQNNITKSNEQQKVQQYLLTELDENIYKNVSIINEDSVNGYLQSTAAVNEHYGDSYIEHMKSGNSFFIKYYVNHKFYKKELYEYKIIHGSIFYECIDYSFVEGDIK